MRSSVLALSGLLVATIALAHGDAQWINDGKYKARDGLPCCDEQDCIRYSADRFRKTPEGIWFMTEDGEPFLMPWTDRNKGLYTSENEDWWACVYTAKYEGAQPQLRCVFVPPGRGS